MGSYWRTLPQPPAPEPETTVQGYGLTLLAFLLETGCYVTCSSDQLESADHAAAIAVRGAGSYYPAVFDRVSAVRHGIAATLRARAILDSEGAAPVPAPVAAGPQERPNTGPMAPLMPAPIVSPPAPARAPLVINF